MRTWLRRIIITLVIILIAIQFVPVNRTNPPTDAAKSIYVVEKMPENLQALLNRSCKDCHTNETHWPWYSYVAPVSWLVANDVHEARHHMNFSEWGTYNAKKRDHELEEVCNWTMGGDMPDGKYLFIHRSAKVTQAEKEALCTWTGSPH